MATCNYCGKEMVNPFKCNYCGENFCSEHRLPPNHGCSGLDSWKSRSGAAIGSHEKKKSWLSRKKESVSQKLSLSLSSQETEENQEESSESDDQSRMRGKVKFYNQRKNYGFIIPEDGEEDVFFRGSDVEEGWVKGGETVEFRREPSRRENPRGRNVVKIKKPTDRLWNGLKKLGQGLKNKWVVRTFSVIIIIITSTWILTSAPWSRLASHFSAYREFLDWAALFLGVSFAFGILVGVAEKKKTKAKLRGEVELPEGSELRFKGPERKVKEPPSRSVIKWVSIVGIIVVILGFVIGGLDFLYGYVIVSVGGFVLGMSPGLLIKRFRRL